MKKISGYIVMVLLIQLALFSSCKEKENEIPSIKITAPADGIMIMGGDQLTIKVKANDDDGFVDEVRFYVFYEKVETQTKAPYEYLWTSSDSVVGNVQIRVVAIDNDGGANSDEITVVVDAPGGFNPELTYGTLDDYDGNTYKTIRIGDQHWMAENLKVTHYADGTPIPFVSEDAEWSSLGDNDRAYCWYDNMEEYKDTSGALYSWSGVMNGASGLTDSSVVVQGVCPDNWHIPTDAEWKELELNLGMSQAAADAYEWRGTDEGGKLKEVGFSHWSNPNSDANNSSGFTALPGGFRSHSGTFYGVGEYATYWSANEKSGSDNVWYRVLHFEQKKVYRHYNLSTQGLSVRCIED